MMLDPDSRLFRLMEARREIELLRYEERDCPIRETLSRAAIEALAEVLRVFPLER